jgi:hypothetical protein
MKRNIVQDGVKRNPLAIKKSIRTKSPPKLRWHKPHVYQLCNPRHFDIAADFAREMLASDPHAGIEATLLFLEAVSIQQKYPTEASNVLEDALLQWGCEHLPTPKAVELHGFWECARMTANIIQRQFAYDEYHYEPNEGRDA